MKLAKRLFALLLVVLTLFSFVPHASAASVNLNETAKEPLPNRDNISICSYALRLSGIIKGIDKKCWIDAQKDRCTIVAIDGENIKIRFPLDTGGTLTRWFNSVEYIGTNLSQEFPVLRTTKSITTFTRYNGGVKFGYTGSGDKIYVIATHANYTGIVYPLTGGGYKLGYVKNSDIQNGTKIISDMVDVTRSFAGKQIKIRSVQNGKYLCADGCQNYTPAMCNRNNASTWETFTVSVTSDGWAGFKAYNGKWLSAANHVANTPLRANGNDLLSWECFKIYKKGSDYYIKAQVNSKWLCVRIDIAGAPVQSYASVVSTWERFQIEVVPSNSTSNSFSPVWPCKNSNYISAMYRYWNNGNPTDHKVRSNIYNAFDVSGTAGDAIYAVEKGVVVERAYQGDGFGHYLVIDHGNGLRTLYGHLKYAASVNVGDTVSRKQVIGYMGKTGNSTGNHLHFEMYEYAPEGKDPEYGKSGYKQAIINPWVTYYQGNVSVTIGGNSYKANKLYVSSDRYAESWCNWLGNNCTKNSSGDYIYRT